MFVTYEGENKYSFTFKNTENTKFHTKNMGGDDHPRNR